MATRGVEGIETRMVGRDHELGMLRDAYLDALESAEPRVVTIIGEAGVGKSRLLYEFGNWLELRPELILYFKGRATPNTQNVPHSLLRDLFAYRFEILDSDSAAVALGKFRAGMAGALEPERADVVGHWLGFDFSSSEAVKSLLGGGDLAPLGRAYLMRYFRALGAPNSAPLPQADSLRYSPAVSSPVVLLLEDLHWADDASLDLVVPLVEALPAARLIVVCAVRPVFLERRPGWGEGEAAFQRVVLKPLPKRASRALVDEVLQRVDEVPDDLRNLIIDAAEGNPFYVEEMVKMLIDQGVIQPSRGAGVQGSGGEEEDVWRVRSEKLEGLRVPPTLTGLLQARLDGLPRPEREALQRASVVGRLFWDDAVADLAHMPVVELRPTLAAVHQRELIFRRERSSFVEAEEYIFKHALLRDVTYETVLLKHRAEFHGRVARWLEEHAGERIGEYLGLIAEHYGQAGDFDRAVDHLMSAGQRELDNLNAVAARPHFERALGLLEANGAKDDPRFLSLRLGLGKAYTMLSDYAPAERLLTGVVDETRRSGNFEQQAEAMNGLAVISYEQGDFVTARTFLDEALPLARINGGRILLDLLTSYSYLDLNTEGRLDIAEEYANEALALARSLGHPQAELAVLYRLAQISTWQRQPERAVEQLERALTIARQRGNLKLEETFNIGLGWMLLWSGDIAASIQYTESALSIERELGSKWGISDGLSNLAFAYTRLGDHATARSHLRQSLILAVGIGAKEIIGWDVVCYGLLEAAAGRLEHGLALIGLAVGESSGTEMALWLPAIFDSQGISGEAAEAGMAAGASLDLETVVEEILAGKW
jgi:tetratricopeptide (TPR) repeat protein